MHKLFPLLLLSCLLGSTACSKKDDPAAPAAPVGVPGTASYKLNGQLVTCQPTAYISTSGGQDRLTISLLTTPKPASGDERLALYFTKPTGQPNSAYKVFQQLYFTAKTPAVGTDLTSPNVTITAISTGGFSGTFAGEAISSAFSYRITEGVFIDIHP